LEADSPSHLAKLLPPVKAFFDPQFRIDF
jgi:hypothetical protein